MDRFCIDDYDGNYCMHCKTKEQALTFLDYLDSVGKTWSNGDSYLKADLWDDYGKETVYYFFDGTYGEVSDCFGETILEFEEFDWSEEELHIEQTMSFDDLFAEGVSV